MSFHRRNLSWVSKDSLFNSLQHLKKVTHTINNCEFRGSQHCYAPNRSTFQSPFLEDYLSYWFYSIRHKGTPMWFFYMFSDVLFLTGPKTICLGNTVSIIGQIHLTNEVEPRTICLSRTMDAKEHVYASWGWLEMIEKTFLYIFAKKIGQETLHWILTVQNLEWVPLAERRKPNLK